MKKVEAEIGKKRKRKKRGVSEKRRREHEKRKGQEEGNRRRREKRDREKTVECCMGIGIGESMGNIRTTPQDSLLLKRSLSTGAKILNERVKVKLFEWFTIHILWSEKKK